MDNTAGKFAYAVLAVVFVGILLYGAILVWPHKVMMSWSDGKFALVVER